MYDLRVIAVLTANDDGSEAATVTADQIRQSVLLANNVYNPHGINFIFDPATDVYQRNSDLLNHDFDRNDNNVYADPNTDPTFGGDPHGAERNAVAQRFPGRLCVYFGAGSRYLFSDAEKRWVYRPRTYNWSNDKDSFVTMTGGDGGTYDFAHEVGHYLHLAHTFNGIPNTIADAAAAIRDFVEKQKHPKDRGADVFDGDLLYTGVIDTPPDPGPQLFKNPCDTAETSVTIPVTFLDGSTQSYTIAPDRENIMNYWNKTCRGKLPDISPGQAARVLDGLRTGNRNHLIVPDTLYVATWEDGDQSQTRALGWALADMQKRTQDEFGHGRKCVHMQAHDIGGGQIRYDGVWEPAGGAQQTFALAQGLADFAKRFDQEAAAGRRAVHVQGYNAGGQVLYDGIWESGSTEGQTRALGWALNDFIGRHQNELSQGRTCTLMHAYDIGGGQIRYDGVWTPMTNAATAQDWLFGATLQTFAARFDAALRDGRHASHVQSYLAEGQVLYDGVWDDGTKGQTRALGWAFNDFVGRCNQEFTAGRRLVRMQAVDIGGGQLRYDAVWEPGINGQVRLLGGALAQTATLFNEYTSTGKHVTLMQACFRAYL
jgi:hypothetical protein